MNDPCGTGWVPPGSATGRGRRGDDVGDAQAPVGGKYADGFGEHRRLWRSTLLRLGVSGAADATKPYLIRLDASTDARTLDVQRREDPGGGSAAATSALQAERTDVVNDARSDLCHGRLCRI
jgi:hypothetical protein